MTESDLVEMLYAVYGTMNDAAVMYFTLVSAYLITSYLVGDKLSRIQLSIINGLYLLWVIGTINTNFTQLSASLTILNELHQMGSAIFTSVSSDYTRLSVVGFLLVQIGGLVASFYFMWSVRHAKT